jgi:hypothetical protein
VKIAKADLAPKDHNLLPVPAHTVAFGLTRTVAAKGPMVAFEGGQYSVPQALLSEQVWVRTHGVGAGEQVIIVHVGQQGRSRLPGTPGPRRASPSCTMRISRRPRPGWIGHREPAPPPSDFLALGQGGVSLCRCQAAAVLGVGSWVVGCW